MLVRHSLPLVNAVKARTAKGPRGPDRRPGELDWSNEQLYAALDIANPHAFTRSELAGTLKSVLRYRARWRSTGWHHPGWLARQAVSRPPEHPRAAAGQGPWRRR
ncbi:MAG: hypothetical protein OXU42_17625 [Deltaproteobacteria bacterium]|nr:hypothetical protein [Deltaproteobacteria bacterium]